MWLQAFIARAHAHPARPAVVTPRVELSYAELWARVRERAAGLPATPSRRAIAAADPLEILEEVLACWQRGLVPAVFHHGLPAAQVDGFRQLFARLSACPSALPAGYLQAPDGTAAEAPPADGEGLILTTSGTTGKPKLVALSHGAVWQAVRGVLEWSAMPETTAQLVATPLSRGTGLNSGILVGLAGGWTVHLFPPDALPSELQAHIRRREIALINATPSFFRLFLSYWNGKPFESVALVGTGGEASSAELLGGLRQAFPHARIAVAYGMTEAGVRIGQQVMDEGYIQEGAMGCPMPYFQVKLLPNPAVAAPAGELLLKGGSVFLGYLQEDGRYRGLDNDGFFHTGDLVAADEAGCLHYRGRVDRLVKLGGFLVNPLEIEATLKALPGILEAQCRVQPNAILGHVIEASVVLAPGAAMDGDAVREACRSRLPRHMVPRAVRVVDEIALTPTGKVAG